MITFNVLQDLAGKTFHIWRVEDNDPTSVYQGEFNEHEKVLTFLQAINEPDLHVISTNPCGSKYSILRKQGYPNLLKSLELRFLEDLSYNLKN